MAAEMYADQVANIRAKLARLDDSTIEQYGDVANNLTEQYNEKMKEYADKWKSVQDAGGEELASVLGVKGIYAGGKKLRDLYRGRQERKAAERERRTQQQDEDVGDDFDEDASPIDDSVRDAVSGEDNSPVDYFTDDGQKYFTGSEADHQEYYKDDGSGELKDPSRIPEGHQATGDDTAPPEEAGAAPDEEDFGFRPSDDLKIAFRDSFRDPPLQQGAMGELPEGAGSAAEGTEAGARPPTSVTDDADVLTGARQPSFEDVVAQGQRDRALRRAGQGSEPSASPDQPAVSQEGFSSSARARPAEVDTSNPFSEGSRTPISSERVGGDSDLLAPEADEGTSFLGRVGSKTFQSLASRGRGIKDAFSGVKNFFSSSSDAATAASGAAEGAEGAAAAGEGLAGLGASDAILGAIPVVGEVGLAISGLVAIGEGIYHLFHPEQKPKAPPPAAPLTAPHMLTRKYAAALPSADSSVDRQASVSTF